MDNFSETYLNPVYQKSFPDPFVLKFRGEYYAYCTDFWHDGRVFGVLKSRDLVNWTEIGGAMERLETDAPFYWAPEVTYSNGKFYLYYSVGNETLMEIRVAVSARPDGGFVDSGKRLTFQDFAIDGHVFTDENGQQYFFYATDFFEHSHIGTGTVVDRMTDFFTLEGNPRPVTRARFDWQVYDANRIEKGGVRWHTVEGAFVLKRKGVYYEMFSGGNWQNVSYGVSFATTDDIARETEWKQFSDGEKTLPILRTIPDSVVGPGHNSVARGVNNREIYCIYHRWTESGRVLAIDRMDFTGGARMYIKGATVTPQPKPFAPAVLDFFDDFSKENWRIENGNWTVENNQLVSDSGENAEIVCVKNAETLLLETSLRAFENSGGNFGVCLKNGDEKVFKVCFSPRESAIRFVRYENGGEIYEEIKPGDDFDFESFQLLRLEADHYALKLKLNEKTLLETVLARAASNFSFFADACRAAFSGVALTLGFENTFESEDTESCGWKQITDNGTANVESKHLVLTETGGKHLILQKDLRFSNFDLAINFSILETSADDFKAGFSLSVDEKRLTHQFSFEKVKTDWVLRVETNEKISQFALPAGFSLNTFHQLCLLKFGNEIQIRLEAEDLGTVEAAENASRINVFAQNATFAFDLIRVTAV